MWAAWHLKGAPDLHTWLTYTAFERAVIAQKLVELIERRNAELGAPDD